MVAANQMKGLAKLIRNHRFIITIDGKTIIDLSASAATLHKIITGKPNETRFDIILQRDINKNINGIVFYEAIDKTDV